MNPKEPSPRVSAFSACHLSLLFSMSEFLAKKAWLKALDPRKVQKLDSSHLAVLTLLVLRRRRSADDPYPYLVTLRCPQRAA
jgi:hypothetical protein